MKEIFVLYHATRSLLLRNHLVELNIGLARRVAHRMVVSCQESYQDLLGLATIGLIKAVERYDPNQKYFTSFALPYIKGEILHFLRDKASPVRISRGLHEMSAKIKKARSHLSASLGHRPSDAEVALYLGISKSQIDEALGASRNQKYIWSLDSKLDDTDDLTLGDTLVGQEAPIDRSDEILGKLREAIASLNNPAIDLVYLKGKQPKVAAMMLGKTEAQINALLWQGIEELSKLEICDLSEASLILSESEDLKNFETSAGYLLPNGMAFLHDWLYGQLAAA
ncbi:sigma-70 family RNA polymerase sigma factor [Nostoc sp. GT001]|uniref:sigma-70 family RNA polymerase sigma factor n=1 Tax=Nostoc sp. GT001 TaxID=3056647 RepID=UPI0025AA6E77|nr:sigma-70 family RNA polymerase sigma factor [Nostoc sp. GT001]MDM9583139.1 sigma-70 family RNA polymerase sigma factor [Nostoc sp. GT001]